MPFFKFNLNKSWWGANTSGVDHRNQTLFPNRYTWNHYSILNVCRNVCIRLSAPKLLAPMKSSAWRSGPINPSRIFQSCWFLSPINCGGGNRFYTILWTKMHWLSKFKKTIQTKPHCISLRLKYCILLHVIHYFQIEGCQYFWGWL